MNVSPIICDRSKFQTKMQRMLSDISGHVHVEERAAVPKCLSNLQLKSELMRVPCAQGRAACSHICCMGRGVATPCCVQV